MKRREVRLKRHINLLLRVVWYEDAGRGGLWAVRHVVRTDKADARSQA